MVKLSFNSALGQKDVKKDSETLIPENTDLEVAMPGRQRQSKAWYWCMCLGVALMLSGVVVGGFYMYREAIAANEKVFSVNLPGEKKARVYTCGVRYLEDDFIIPEEDEEAFANSPSKMLQEKIRVLQDEEVALISVPVPEFDDSDPADIVHDFNRRLTAYLDLYLNKCYIITLNTSVVMPPKDLLDLLINIKAGTYLPQSYLVHEEMIVTERLEHVEKMGYFIKNLCQGKETYKLERRDRILGMQKREALNCHKIRHFENKFVVETLICDA
ncbi:hypothetical protein UPYG_G00309560 [Umbra pygmaea]|uniref:Integral membrane protein 2 n=1 Tax=Umbra pygmaea TaxID=75934 RepID=A0ABD0W097_UMBPY